VRGYFFLPSSDFRFPISDFKTLSLFDFRPDFSTLNPFPDMAKKAVLLLNLGSPASTSIPDVRAYLREFLMDERVIDKGFIARWIIVNCLILPTRPKNTAAAYQRIWTEEGSPLITMSERVRGLVDDQLDFPVYLGMRYGEPSIPAVVDQMLADGVEELFSIPLYPHYAASSYETAVVRLDEVIQEKGSKLRITHMQPFYGDLDYIAALVETAKDDLARDYDHLLISFHGIPIRHLRKADPSGSHCQVVENCCETPHPCQKTCYRYHSMKTAWRFVKSAGIPDDKWSVSFQSRLGREPWMEPYTDQEIERLAKEGKKNLLVICPAFVTDCLETLEEISMEGKDIFLEAGGEQFHQIPCLNDHPKWVDLLANRSRQWAGS